MASQRSLSLMLEMKLTGDPDMEKFFAALPKKITRSIAFESLVRATLPVVDAMKEEAPVVEGDLKQSIGLRLRRYSGGKRMFAAIGPKWDYVGPDGDRPAAVAHLVENGHVARDGTMVAPNAFARRAWLRTKDATLAAFKDEFGNRMTVEINNRAAKKRKTK